MSKYPKSIVISFRLSPLVIAKAIDGLKHYDKSADIGKLSSIIKQVTLHGLNYLTSALPWEPSNESQRQVQMLTTQGKQEISLEQSILGSRSEATSIRNKPTNQTKPTTFLEKTEKSVVTDFSLPEELRQEIEDQKE